MRILKLANGHIISFSPSSDFNCKFSSPLFKNSKRYSSNSTLLPKPSGIPFEIPFAVMDRAIVDHIINNHSIASLKEVIDNLIFTYAAQTGLLVVGNCYKLEVFIPLTIPGDLQMVPLFKYGSSEVHLYFSYNEVLKSGDISTAIHSRVSGLANSDKYEFTGHILLFKFTPCCIPQGTELGELISTHTIATVLERYGE